MIGLAVADGDLLWGRLAQRCALFSCRQLVLLKEKHHENDLGLKRVLTLEIGAWGYQIEESRQMSSFFTVTSPPRANTSIPTSLGGEPVIDSV